MYATLSNGDDVGRNRSSPEPLLNDSHETSFSRFGRTVPEEDCSPKPLLNDAAESSSANFTPPDGRSTFRFWRGALLIVFYLLTWSGQSEVSHSLFAGRDDCEAYYHPALLAYLNRTLLAFLLLLACFVDGKQDLLKRWMGTRSVWWSLWSHALLSLSYFLCIYCWLSGLKFINASSSNAIYQLQALFTLVLSRILLKERIETWLKVAGCSLAAVGVVVIVYPMLRDDASNDDVQMTQIVKSDGDEGNGFFNVGVLLTLCSAFCWGLYTVCCSYFYGCRKRQLDDESSTREAMIDSMVTLGVLGVCNFVFVAPIVGIFHVTSVETMVFPCHCQLIQILFNFALSFIFDLTFILSVYFTNPTVVSICAPLTIPLCMVYEALNHETKIHTESLLGSCLVLAGLYMQHR